MRFLDCNGVVLHARRTGRPGGPPIVFANSLGTDARIWEAVVERLGATHDVLLYDKRGHGLSEAPPGPYRIEDHAADLLALADAMAIERFALVGLSVGGMIAQCVAADRPERVGALVLCDTGARIGDAEGWNARIAAVEEGGIAAVADGVLERWFTRAYREREPAAMAGWHAMLTRQPARGYAATCAGIRDADLRARAARIGAPTLCVVGSEDRSTPPELMRETAGLIPGSRFETIEAAGHLPCLERPERLADLIADHLAASGWR